MAEKQTPWLTYALLGGAAYLAYWMWQKGQAAQPATAQPTSFDPTNGLPPATGVTTPGIVTSPVPSQVLPVMSSTPATPNGIDPNVYSVVMSWAQTDGRAPVLAMAAAQIPSEYAGMYNLITNYWDKNVDPIPQPEVDFWNNLRDKYDPQHLVW